MSLQRFAASHVRKRSRRAGAAPDPADCLEVSGVAAICPAQEAGIEVGDLLVEAANVSGARLEQDLGLLTGLRSVTYRFYSPARSEEVSFVSDGAPLGLELRLTPQAVEATYSPESFDPGPLMVLWRAGRWELLERLAQATLQARANPSLAEGMAESGASPRDTPALILLAAAVYAQGRREEGMALVAEYEAYGSHWTQKFMGISAWIQGQEAKTSGDEERAKELLELAWDLAEEERVADACEELGLPRPTRERPWVGKRLPSYRLLRVFGSGAVGQAEAREALAPGQLLTVCALATYRANGPYHEFMTRYCGYLRTLEGSLARLHVITSCPQPTEAQRTWLEAESIARKAKVPLEVLKEEGELTEALGLTASPTIFLVVPDGTVVYQGLLDSGRELWAALAAAYERTAVFPPPAQRRFPGDPEPFRARDCLTFVVPLFALALGAVVGALEWGWLGSVGLGAAGAFAAIVLVAMLNPPEEGG